MSESTTTRQVETKFVADDSQARPVLATMTQAATRLSGRFNAASASLSGFLGLAGGLAGVFSLGNVISTTTEHFKAVKRIAMVTGMAAERADGLREAMELAGVEASDAERIMLMMSKRGARMEEAARGAAGAVGGMAQQFRTMGVDVHKGPEAAIMQMSKMVKAGQVDVTDLMLKFGLRPQQAMQMMTLLNKGPKALKETIDDVAKSGAAVNADNLATMSRITQLHRQIDNSWEQIKMSIGKQLLPTVERLMSIVQNKLQSWEKHAESFGKILGSSLESAVEVAAKLGKLLLVNAVLSKVTGRGLGDYGIAAAKFAFPGGRLLGAARAADYGVVANGASMVRYAGGMVARGTSSAVIAEGGGAMSMVARVVSGFMRLRPLLTGLGRLFGLGLLIEVLVAGVGEIMNTGSGWLKAIKDTWGNVMVHVKGIAGYFTTGPIGWFFKTALPAVITGLGVVVENILYFVRMIGGFIGAIIDSPSKALHPIDTFREVKGDLDFELEMARLDRIIAERDAAKSANRPTPDARERAPNFDFRGSKFDIKQQFAEGFDPDRIATAFATDLASLGERRSQSALVPLASIR